MSAQAALPGPKPDPLVGALGHVVRFSRDIVGQSNALFDRYGPIASVVGGDLKKWPRLARWVLVQGADLHREIVARTEDFHKPPLNKQLAPKGRTLNERNNALKRWGAGLFNLNGEAHREHRRILMPAFHKNSVDGYCAAMTAIIDDELRQWRPGTVRDLRDDMTFLTLRIVARCLVGENVTDRGENSIGSLIQRTLRLGLRPTVFLLPIDLPGFPYRRFLDAVEQTDGAVQKAIALKRRGAADNDDMLAMLLQAKCEDGSSLSEDHIIEHTGVMFIAGQETSSNALIWTLLLLSQHPSVAADLLDEIEGLLRGADPSAEQIGELPFLDAVVRESLRVLPPVPMNARVVARDTEFRGYLLPAGTQLLVSLYHTHRSPDVFSHPNRFDPYRWKSCKPAAYAFSPFGVGPRTCIGAQFAVMEIKLVLAMLLQRFRLEFIPGTRVDRAAVITMSVKGSLPMRINPQDRQFARGVGGLEGNLREMIDLAR